MCTQREISRNVSAVVGGIRTSVFTSICDGVILIALQFLNPSAVISLVREKVAFV